MDIHCIPSDKLLEILQLSHSLFEIQPVTVQQAMSLLGKANFCAMNMHKFASCVV